MSRRPIDARIHAHEGKARPVGRGVPEERFREAMARWPTGVAVVAVRDPDDGRVHATTVGSLGGVSADPPRIVLSLGPGAQVLPFLDEGRTFAASVLSREQRAVASRFTDPFPVGPSPFPDEGPPLVAGAHVHLVCRTETIVPVDGARLVMALVEEADTHDTAGPLLYYHRGYRELG